MKLTTLQKVRVIFCLTCVYSAHHGWTMEDSEKTMGSKSSTDPQHVVFDEDFQEFTDIEIEYALALQQKTWFQRNVTSLFYTTEKPPTVEAPPSVSKTTEPLKSTSAEGQNLAVALLVQIDGPTFTQEPPHQSFTQEESDEESEEENSSTPRNSCDGEEEVEETGDHDKEESSVSNTSVHEDLKEKGFELVLSVSESPVKDILDEAVVGQDFVAEDVGENSEEAKKVLNVSTEKSTDGPPLSLTSDLSIMLPEKRDSEQITEHLQHAATIENAEILPSVSADLTSGREGEGTHIFNQGHDSSGTLDAGIMALLSEKVVMARQALSEGKEHVIQTATNFWNDPDFWKNLVEESGDYDVQYSSLFG